MISYKKIHYNLIISIGQGRNHMAISNNAKKNFEKIKHLFIYLFIVFSVFFLN